MNNHKPDEINLPQMIAQAAAEQSFDTPQLDVQAAVREADRRRLTRQLSILAVGMVLSLIAVMIGIAVLLEMGRQMEIFWLAAVISAGMVVWVWSGLAAVVIFCKRMERQREKGVVR